MDDLSKKIVEEYNKGGSNSIERLSKMFGVTPYRVDKALDLHWKTLRNYN